MDLKNFGHATNLDCSVSNGQTWLWTGSDCKGNDVSRAISGFRYQKNKTLRKHGTIHYKIPDAKSKKYMTNVYPAINQNSTQMAVRYTYGGKQYYQIYNLANGRFINPRNPVKRICLSATSWDLTCTELQSIQSKAVRESHFSLVMTVPDAISRQKSAAIIMR